LGGGGPLRTTAARTARVSIRSQLPTDVTPFASRPTRPTITPHPPTNQAAASAIASAQGGSDSQAVGQVRVRLEG